MNIRNQSDLSIVLLLLLVLGLACSSSPGTGPPAQQQPATPTPTANTTAGPDTSHNPTTDPETAKLRDKVNELEKKVAEQQKQPVQPGQTPPAPPPIKTPPPVIRNSGGNAWVNSPGDGFLALRSEPSSDVGYRIAQIPHGAYVRVGGCQSYSQRIGGNTGRWCRVSYNGYSGWAFDAWLVR